jgi:hypothetical protein
MTTILTPQEIVHLVFTTGENYNNSMITESDIAIAESCYLLPIVGQMLYEKLSTGGYSELVDDYVAPMLGAWVRYIIEPRLDERCGLGHSAKGVDREKLKHLRCVASKLSHRLSDFLNVNSDDYPEYNPCDNPLNHCSIDGNIVQIY